MNVGIYVYDEAEVLDFSAPFEVFSVASRFLKEDEKFNVFLVSQENMTIKARGSYSVNTNHNFSNHPPIDVFIVVGGVHTYELEKPEVISWIAQTAKTATINASICTGAFLFAKAKVIVNQTVTTHWEDIPDLRNDYPDLDVKEGVRWVDEGDVISSAGISAGIDMSLHLISKIKGTELAIKTAVQMDYNWTTNN